MPSLDTGNMVTEIYAGFCPYESSPSGSWMKYIKDMNEIYQAIVKYLKYLNNLINLMERSS